ncbi:MAG: hypothetical protein UW92_C0003G0021 [Candidatus Jorgensenbacteria bacterium GW2011_GWA2_45_13]|uniref:Uncharacterized protein n=1 Tax=Candidatus Jorgensenbacteria bacterium GW2011_GWA2_45_13 TaxID=1618662 RepID=A0A0G1P7E8_9BACT|nr:MAG: hypothetical protein UW92_C0003G0021 [Candidatus Jorgensenbacteria bacterium GW2011_GWA2_45_13]
MRQEIKNILNDVYTVDPSLRAHEQKLIVIIEHLLELRPDTGYDKTFEEKLRTELSLQIEKGMRSRKYAKAFSFPIGRPSFFIPAGALVVLLTVFAAGGWYLSGVGTITIFPSSPQIAKVGGEAFGQLSVLAPSPVVNSFSVSENAPTKQSSEMDIPVGMGGGVMSVMGMAPLGKVDLQFRSITKLVYRGTDIPIPDQSMEVLKRVTPKNAASQLATLLKKADLGLINLNTLENAHVDSLTLTEGGEYRHTITIDLVDGSVSIQPNWETWPNIYRACKVGGLCINQRPLTPSDVPDDDTLVKTANSFLAHYDISIAFFAPPEVDRSWKNSASEDSFAPDSVSVLYPFRIDGKDVYNQSGGKEGMTVTIDIRTGRVSNVFGLEVADYTASLYPMETNTSLIIATAERGGAQGESEPTPLSSVNEIDLETPSLAYISLDVPEAGMQSSQHFLVPAYVFPVIHIADGTQYFSKNVVVPLAKIFFDQSVSTPNKL